MLRVCIIEDEEYNVTKLEEYLLRFGKENDVSFHIDKYKDGLTFLDSYSPACDLVFMDIQLPNINGMETAKRLRKIDDEVGIIFVTNLIKYAVNGYEVRAFDYILKPLNYYDFSVRMKKFLAVSSLKKKKEIVLCSRGVMKRIAVDGIYYVEVVGHDLCWHTTAGDVVLYGSLVAAAKMLPSLSFAKCNSGILVNLNHVQSLDKDRVLVAGRYLPISRPKKKEFVTAVTNFFAEILS